MPQLDLSGISSWIFPIAIIAIFFFLIILPQRRKDKKAKEMLGNLRTGDKIKTIGGLYGKIVAVKEDLITIEVGPEKVKMVFAKGAVAAVESSDFENEMVDKTLDSGKGKK